MATISTKVQKLNTKAPIPSIGLGTWQAPDKECYEAVKTALQDGYRHIDTARVYQNEESVGQAINDFIKESGIPRSEIFVTTKLWCTDSQDPEGALRKSLDRLKLDYVDLYLIHWPVSMAAGDDLFPTAADGSRKVLPFDEWNYVKTYVLLQKTVELGLAKAIGISNFNIAKIEHLLADSAVTITPAALQVELHPYLPQFELVEYAKSKDIIIEAYSPLGSTGAPLLKDSTLIKLGEKYGVSPATIALSWNVARDVVILPKSTNPARLASNLKTIELSKEDIEAINDISKTITKRVVEPNWGVDIFNSGATF